MVKFNPQKHKGHINCKRLNKTVYVNANAEVHPQYGWICDCGNWTKLDPYYHDGLVEGVEL
jgi:hypothetical protein